MVATISSATLLGVDGHAVSVEAQVAPGLPGVTIIGLPDAACREARDRVRSALTSSGLPWPQTRTTVNLAPPTVRKVGSGLDLAVAVALLIAMEEVRAEAADGLAFIGELGLDGRVRPVPGVVCLVGAVQAPVVVVPEASTAEAAVAGTHEVRPVGTLGQLVARLRGEEPWRQAEPPPEPPRRAPGPDLADVRGQPVARLGLELAAAGGHHLLLAGPPGAGKTMLAARLPGLLPPLEPGSALETTRIHSAAGQVLPVDGLLRHPPFRAPHHGASAVALIGGGSAAMRPGEISLAANGVLFLDELSEFAPAVLDALRQPLEEGVVRVARAAASVSFPARFLLVAATNPCPCGEAGRPGACSCSDAARLRYQRRLSGPLLDRFDLRIEVPKPEVDDLLRGPSGESTAAVAARVEVARARASARGVPCNAELPSDRLDEVAPLTPAATDLLEAALRAGRLSGRGLHRVRRVARTIADLGDRSGPLQPSDMALALSLRAAALGERRLAAVG